ncbi:30S ribosomal protein S15 [Patescibacteria group bacterium]|nr:30S ribosomal protein S15 [Patescibacteria group bacterium]
MTKTKDRNKKAKLIEEFKIHESDTGSAEVQIAILSNEVGQLTGHLKTHKKDFSSRKGLLRKIGQRRRLLKFLEKDNPESYEKLIKKLKLKR